MTQKPRVHHRRSLFPKILSLSISAYFAGCGQGTSPNNSIHHDQLSSTAVLPAGTDCSSGGLVVQTGEDINQNSELDAFEVTASETVCNEASDVLSRTTALEPGEECPAGGTLVQSGIDLNDNGILDDTEIKTQEVTCFPEEEPNDTLILIETETPGSNCANGGSKVSTGVDDNGNGVLDEEEVQSSQYLCDDAPLLDPQPLVEVEDEGEGTNCTYGGTRISSGNDDNQNGILEAEEVDSVSYLCDDPPAEPPPATLVSLETEQAGTNCPEGGTRISSGLDENSDGILDEEEIDTTQYICNPEVPDPPVTLVLSETVEPGPDCPAGGTRIVTGIDEDLDELLSEEEIEDVTFICNGIPGDLNADRCTGGAILEGAFDIQTVEDLAQFDGVVCIKGALIINGSSLTNFTGLEGIVEISDDLVVTNNNSLTSLQGLENLIEVKGDFSLNNNNALEEVSHLTSLSDVRGTFLINNNDVLSAVLGLDSLYELSGALFISNNDALSSLSGFSNLSELGSFSLENNNSLLTLNDFSALTIVRENLYVLSMNGLAAIEFAQLDTIAGVLMIRYHDNPTLVSFPALTYLGSTMYIETNESIETVSAPLLSWAGGGFSFKTNASLQTVIMPELVYLSGTFYFLSNSSLISFDLTKLSTIGGDFYFSVNDAIQDFNGLDNLKSVGGWFYIGVNNSLETSEGFSSLISTGEYFLILANPSLTSVSDFSSLQDVGGYFKIEDNPLLPTANAQALANQTTVSGDTIIVDNGP